MKALNRILRIALASTLALSQGAWFPALAANGKHQAVVTIGADELKSEYGAGGGGGGSDPVVDPGTGGGGGTTNPFPSMCTWDKDNDGKCDSFSYSLIEKNVRKWNSN